MEPAHARAMYTSSSSSSHPYEYGEQSMYSIHLPIVNPRLGFAWYIPERVGERQHINKAWGWQGPSSGLRAAMILDR